MRKAPLKSKSLTVVVAICTIALSGITNAGVIELTPNADASVWDFNDDGIADRIGNWNRNEVYSPNNVRTVIEFDLSNFSAGAMVSSAILGISEFTTHAGMGIDLFAYNANGSVELADWGRTDIFQQTFITDGILDRLEFDVSTVIQTLINANATHAGFLFKDDPNNIGVIWGTYDSNSNPENITSLTLSFDSIPVPEPSTFAICTIAALGLASRKFKKRVS